MSTIKTAPLAFTMLVFSCGMVPCAIAQSSVTFGPISVPGTSVVFDPDGVLSAASLAGLQGGDGNHSPTPAVQAMSFSPATGQVFTFSASGKVSFNYNIASDTVGPDGTPGNDDIASLGSISGWSAPVGFPLVGVFTNGAPAGPAPPDYDYSGGVNQATFSPQLNQVFFIGDGMTGTGSGSVQTFNVPATATQLWLGFPDMHLSGQQPFAYGDNSGSLAVSGTLNPGELGPPSLSVAISASAFGAFSDAAPGTWIEIYGANLAFFTRGWAGTDFDGSNAPTSLNNTKVTIGKEDAFVDYISPGQVNALIPSTLATGPQALTVTSQSGTSTPYTLNINPVEPGYLAPSNFKIGGVQYVVAQFADGTYVLPTGAISGINSRPAKSGDTVVIYGVGFGPVSPNTPAGQIVQGANSLASSFQISIGGIAVTPAYAGLAPGYTGLYQFNITIPTGLSSGTEPLTFKVDGHAGVQTLNLAVTD